MTPLLLFVAAACTPSDEDCGTGFERRDDGNCYEMSSDTGAGDDGGATDDGGADGEGATLEDVLSGLDDCELAATDGRLDLDAGCADGACVGMTLAEMEAELGAATCEVFRYEFGDFGYSQVSCEWSQGLRAYFDDLDEDGQADTTATAFGLYIDLPWDGGTAAGLGLDASMSCFIDLLGSPETVDFEEVSGEYFVVGLSFGDPNIYVDDWYDNLTLAFMPDGVADRISMY